MRTGGFGPLSLMILNIATIPHSGSKLLIDDILDVPHQPNNQTPIDGINFFTHIHTYNAPLHQMRFEQYPTIVALRHPLLVATSWKKRGKEVSEMCVLWYILVEMLDKYDPYYLPVDHKDRDLYLQKINEGLGLDLKTDWPMVNSKHNTLKPEDLGEDQEQVDRLCNNIKPFLQKIYPRKPRGNPKRTSSKSPAKTGNNRRERHSQERGSNINNRQIL